LIKTLKKDPIYQIYVNLRETYMKTADPQFTSLQVKLMHCRKIMAQQMETDKDRKFFPDANSTLRVTMEK
jgi:hypothetical protein